MTPAAALTMLARQLAEGGETVTLRRYTNPTLTTYEDTDPFLAKVIQVTPEEIANGVSANKRRAIISPADIGDGAVAVNKDAVIVDGRKYTITAWSPIRIGTTPVRINAELG